jgi:hypothetical protein
MEYTTNSCSWPSRHTGSNPVGSISMNSIKYRLKLDYYREGGCAEFFDIVNHKNIGFKQFKSKKHCDDAFKTQKLLNRYNLAPIIHGKICKIQIEHENTTYESNWGFITEKAKIVHNIKISEIQKLVDAIYKCS